ncbi:hypothetical protein BF14_034315 [Streptomyces griseus]|uniref:hypothetical protein n=1 Tax=Streptomyces globisporus TaxID=1908 RepID=UPI0005DFBC35|nr:hypothetical protein [Streptomyces globisporus]AWL90854.1 hypothetical protein DIJ69_34515 [Streptomyces globisporus]PPA38127.1 hypothetical protein BF14_034315 [Streptomyces griseus]RAN13235.1 hypothetical protein A3838_33705 [Streptomyces badius]
MAHHLEPRPMTAYRHPYAPAPAPLSGPVQLHVERHQEQHEVIVWVPDATGRMVPVSRSHADALIAAVPATLPRDLTPQPLVDSRAQVVLAAGVGTGAAAAGIGYGLGQVIAPLAAFASSGALWALALVAVIGAAARRPPQTTTHVTNHVDARWWGRATSDTRTR